MTISPQNLYISVVEIFGIFMPGVIIVLFINQHFPDFVASLEFTNSNKDYIWAIVLFYSYIFGHFFNRLGSALDHILYERLYLNSRNDKLQKKVQDLLKVQQENDYNLPIFVIAKLYVIQNNSPVLQKAEKEAADSKFFRSLFVIAVIIAVVFFYKNNYLLFFGSLILGLFSCYQYMKLRHKSANTIYEFVIFDKLIKPSHS
jgi:hypothetical protein